MPPLRRLARPWDLLAVAALAAAAFVHLDVRRDERAHARALAEAAPRAARLAATSAWRDASGVAVPSAPRWIRALAPFLSADGTLEVACGAADGTIRFHDGATGALLRAWPAHHRRAVTALHRAGGVVASGDGSGVLVVADERDGSQRFERAVGREIAAVLVLPSAGMVVAVGRDGARFRFALADGASLGEAAPSPYSILAIDPDLADGAVAWAAAGGNLRAWDVETDRRVGRAQVDATRRIDALAVDARRSVAAIARRDGHLSVWDTRAGTSLAAWVPPAAAGAVTCLAFSPDGAVLFAGTAEGEVLRYDAGSGRLLGRGRAAGDQLAVVVAAPDGERVFAAGRRGLLHVWRPGTP